MTRPDDKTHLSRYGDQAVAGEVVVIARAGKPQVGLVPVEPQLPPQASGLSGRPGMHRRRSQMQFRG